LPALLGLLTCQVMAIIGVIVLIGWPIMMSDFALPTENKSARELIDHRP
jgi:hypothetical protein